jgi:hypothetical protein
MANIHPEFTDFQEAVNEHYRFMKIEYTDTVINLACKMAAIAPKTCECGCTLNVHELAYRFHINIEPFLCFSCITKYEKAGATIIPDEPGTPRRLNMTLQK